MSAEQKEKLNIYIDAATARKIKIECAKRGLTQGELIAELWNTYEQAQVQTVQIEPEPGADAAAQAKKRIAEMEKRKKAEAEAEQRHKRIEKAKIIAAEWEHFDTELIELYAARMEQIGEKALSKELKSIADIKRRIL